MNDVVLDSSALIALLDREDGWEVVEAAQPGALVSVVNLAEVVTKLAERGVPAEHAAKVAIASNPVVMPLTPDQVVDVARLRPMTRRWGLSLGDRCCLALARARGATVLTCDAAWLLAAESLGLKIADIRSARH